MPVIRIPLWPVVIVLSLLSGMVISGSVPRAISQDKPAAKPCDVAVIDVSRVFEKCTKFQEEMQRLKAEVESFEPVLRQAQKELAETKQRLDAAAKGSPEQRTLELDLATKNANLQVEMKVKREKFLLDEAAIYARWYRQVQKSVREVAAREQVRVVLRTNSETFDDKDRAAVLQAVNRPIVFQDQIDITDEVLKTLNAA
jgi:Skp family chaperone for outer membrane proteins